MAHNDTHAAMRVGDLAARTGLSVRALHHYEEIGLLPAPERSAAGHRLYGAPTVERLYRIGRLRRLGLSLEQVGRILDDPEWDLEDELRRHAGTLEREAGRLAALTHAVTSALDRVAHQTDPTHDLLEVLSTMETIDGPLRQRLSILVYEDLEAAHEHLVEVFGMTAGPLTRADDGNVVHGEVFAGDGVIWLHPETEEYGLASPAKLGAATASMAVMVDDVDDHHRLVVGRGGTIEYPPVDQPYGYREYGARDTEGRLWSFMRMLDPAG